MSLSPLRNPKPISALRVLRLIIPTRRCCHSSSTSKQEFTAAEEEDKYKKDSADSPPGDSNGTGSKTELAGSWRSAILTKMKGLLGHIRSEEEIHVEKGNAKINITSLENSACQVSQQEIDNDLPESTYQSSKAENSEERILATSKLYLTGKSSSNMKGLNASGVIPAFGAKAHFEQHVMKEQPSQAENLLCFDHQALTAASMVSLDSATDVAKPMKGTNHKMNMHSVQPSDAASEIGELPASAASAGKIKGLQELLTQRNTEQFVPALGKAKGVEIKGLIDSIKTLPPSKGPLSISSEGVGLFDVSCSLSNGGVTERMQDQSGEEQTIKKKNYATDRSKRACGAEAVEKSLHLTPDTIFTEMSRQTNLHIRFLDKNIHEDSFFSELADCGLVAIFPLLKGSKFKDICLQFKTKEGLQKAMGKIKWVLASDAFVDQTSSKDPCNKIRVPSAIDDPDIPDELLKNPTRTVKIKELTPDVTLDQLKEALTSCTSSITSLFLGNSSSVAFAEFKTEDAKEKTIEKYAIAVAGKGLPVFRVDAPPTTVVRITNFNQKSIGKLISICRNHGKVERAQLRSPYAIDVQFKSSEWPAMLNIVNSLNGMVVDGKQWVAVPAPLIPPEVLYIFWGHPDGRKHVKAVLYRLLHDIWGSNASELADTVAKVCGDDC